MKLNYLRDIARAKKQLVRRWEKRGPHENFGDDVIRALLDKYPDRYTGAGKECSEAITEFCGWCYSYTGESNA